jgi:hypothetical protein
MPKPSLWSQVFLHGEKPMWNQCVSDFAVNCFLQWPDASGDREPRDFVAQLWIETPSRWARGERKEKLGAA